MKKTLQVLCALNRHEALSVDQYQRVLLTNVWFIIQIYALFLLGGFMMVLAGMLMFGGLSTAGAAPVVGAAAMVIIGIFCLVLFILAMLAAIYFSIMAQIMRLHDFGYSGWWLLLLLVLELALLFMSMVPAVLVATFSAAVGICLLMSAGEAQTRWPQRILYAQAPSKVKRVVIFVMLVLMLINMMISPVTILAGEDYTLEQILNPENISQELEQILNSQNFSQE